MKKISVDKFVLISIIVFTVGFIVVGLLVSVVKQAEPKISKWEKITEAGVSVGDSMMFEYQVSVARAVDFPEEMPRYGDLVCAKVLHDTIFVEYYHGHEHQRNMFRYRHGE